MKEISSENLLLHSDVADYQTELRDLRKETRKLRMKCYELGEEKKQNEAEIRDLRRFVELLKSNQAAGDIHSQLCLYSDNLSNFIS